LISILWVGTESTEKEFAAELVRGVGDVHKFMGAADKEAIE